MFELTKWVDVLESVTTKRPELIDISTKLQTNFFQQIVAKAQCWTSGWFCYSSWCGSYCGTQTVQGIKYCYYYEYLVYDPTSSACTNRKTCVDPCTQGCWETVCTTCACPSSY
jgi:hypothetical protein